MQPSQNQPIFFFNLAKFHQKEKPKKNPKFENQAVWKVFSCQKWVRGVKKKKKGNFPELCTYFGFIVQPKIERRMIKEMIFFWAEGSKKIWGNNFLLGRGGAGMCTKTKVAFNSLGQLSAHPLTSPCCVGAAHQEL
jgi:hypothetical protein